MPLMTSLTRVCEPKPMATPTMPAPAISGPISTPERRQGHHHGDDRQHHEEHIAEDRQQRSQPRLPDGRLGSGRGQGLGLAEPPVDQRLDHLPDQVGDQQDHDAAQRAPQEAGQEGVAAGHLDQVDLPGVGEQKGGADDQERPDAAIEEDRHEAWRGRRLGSSDRTRDMMARHPGDRDGPGQEERDRREPEQAHETRRPRAPRAAPGRGTGARGRSCDGPGVASCPEGASDAARPGPNDIQRDGEQPKPEGIGDELAGLRREARGR